jgi:hypothetical protein
MEHSESQHLAARAGSASQGPVLADSMAVTRNSTAAASCAARLDRTGDTGDGFVHTPRQQVGSDGRLAHEWRFLLSNLLSPFKATPGGARPQEQLEPLFFFAQIVTPRPTSYTY